MGLPDLISCYSENNVCLILYLFHRSIWRVVPRGTNIIQVDIWSSLFHFSSHCCRFSSWWNKNEVCLALHNLVNPFGFWRFFYIFFFKFLLLYCRMTLAILYASTCFLKFYKNSLCFKYLTIIMFLFHIIPVGSKSHVAAWSCFEIPRSCQKLVLHLSLCSPCCHEGESRNLFSFRRTIF